MKKLMFILYWIIATEGEAQVFRSPVYMRYLETGTYSRHFTDVFAVLGNQAVLPKLEAPAAGVSSERRYLVKELNAFTAVMAYPLHGAGVALSASYAGSASYHESQLGLAYGKALGKAIDIGVQFNYNSRSIEGYGNTGDINCEIGVIMHFTEKVHGGFHLYNPVTGLREKHYQEKLPAVYTVGLGYEASDKLLCSSIIGKEESQPVNVNVAIHYAVVPRFFVRAGIATGTGTYFAGAGISWNNCRMDVAASCHPQLGVTPSILFVFHGKNASGTEE